jgi:cytoplasmic iron level regulating protein YaaA (DUF328/UPF0246 family)
MCVAIVVNVEQFRRQRVATVVTLALCSINSYSHTQRVRLTGKNEHIGATSILILLPPSEGKAAGGNADQSWNPASGTFSETLQDKCLTVVKALKKLRGGDAALLGVKGEHLERARRVNASLIGSPSLPAWQRYTGVVWDHLDLASMSATERRRAVSSLAVVSALTGLVMASDPLPDYRLKMGARLDSIGSLATWWRPEVTSALLPVSRRRTVVDLLPQEHRGAIEWDQLAGVARIELVAKSGGKVGGHNAKAAKGLLARHLLSATSSGSTVAKAAASFKNAEYSANVVMI